MNIYLFSLGIPLTCFSSIVSNTERFPYGRGFSPPVSIKKIIPNDSSGNIPFKNIIKDNKRNS
jgi:hypothetical protein